MTSGSFGKSLKLHLFSRVARITFPAAPEHNIEGTKQTRMKKKLTSTLKLIFAQPQVTHMEIGINHTMQIFIVYSFITGSFSCKLLQTRKSSVCKMGLTGLHDSYCSWLLYICRFLFGLSSFFVASLLFIKGTLYCVVRRK